MISALRLFGASLSVALIGSLAPPPVSVAPLAGQSTPQCRDLITGQASILGTVCVSVSEVEVEIVITPSPGVRLLETRAAVAATLDGFPLSESGVPRLGLFPHARTHQPPAERASLHISRSDLELSSELFVSVHASVVDDLQEEHGAWAAGTRFRPQGMPATYFVVPTLE